MIGSKKVLLILIFQILIFAVVILNPAITKAQNEDDSVTIFDDTVFVWYGNFSGLPISGGINEIINVDVYVKMTEDAWIGNTCIPLGFNKTYIDTIFKDSCQIHWPLTEWDDASFPTFNDEYDTLQPGWNSLSFIGFVDLGGPANTYFHSSAITRILTFAAHSVGDLSLFGSTVEAFGPGLDRFQGPTNFGDTLGGVGYTPIEVFCELTFVTPTGAISGAVTDTSGFAIDDVVVTIADSLFIDTLFTDTTDIQGFYSFGSVNVGTYSISFSHSDYYDTIFSNINVTEDYTTALNVVLNFNAYGGVTGIVADTSGLPIAGVFVEIADIFESDITDEQGEYLIGNVLIDQYSISFSHSNYHDTTINGVEIIQNDTITLNMIMSIDLPNEIILRQNYPNPFNDGTIIEFSLPKSAHVVIEIFDILGRKVETVASLYGQAGTNSIRWNATDISSGIYYYRIKSGGFYKSKALLYIK